MTPENAIIQQARDLAEYWATLPGKTPRQRCDGLAFSIMSMLDGMGDKDGPAITVLLDGRPVRGSLHERYFAAKGGE